MLLFNKSNKNIKSETYFIFNIHRTFGFILFYQNFVLKCDFF
jgi:hypothetical protein